MAENPAQWGPAVVIINDLLDEMDAERIDPQAVFMCGWTRPFRIAQALKAAGLLAEEAVWIKGPDE